MPRRLAVAALLVALASPSAAHAWTDAAVRGVHATVDVEPDGTAYVTLRLTVRVHAGWLEGLELNGLDEDLVLDETAPPTAVTADGQELTPSVRVLHGGRVQLGFRGRSPRRGVTMVTLSYWTSLAHRRTAPVEGEDRVRVRWVLPGWSSGLDGPQIEVHVPEGSRLAPGQEGDLESGTETSVEPEGQATVLRWRRAHLPRTVPWAVAVDVPAEAMDVGLRGPPLVELPRPSSVAAQAEDPRPYWLGFAAWLVLMAWLKLYATRTLGQRARRAARPLVPLPVWARALLIGAAGAGGAAASLYDWRLAAGAFALVSVLATYRPAGPTAAPRLGAWRAVDARWLAAARRRGWTRWIEPIALVDATTVAGALHLAALLAVPWVWREPALPLSQTLLLSVLPLPLFVSGTRIAFPLGATETLWRLLRMCRRLRHVPDGVGLRPVMHVSTDGHMQDARVRTALEHRPDGLLRLDLAMGALPHAGGTETVPMLLILTRAGRPLEATLRERFGELVTVTSRGGRRVLRAVVIRDGDLSILGQLVEAFADCPAAPTQPRGAPAPQQTIAELPPPRAVGF